MLRKLIVCALVLGCSVPSSGCLLMAAGVVVAVNKKKHNHEKTCEAMKAAQASDPSVVVPQDCYKKAKGGA